MASRMSKYKIVFTEFSTYTILISTQVFEMDKHKEEQVKHRDELVAGRDVESVWC